MQPNFPVIHNYSDIESFTIDCNTLKVTDPCYYNDIWCSGEIENALNGTWKVRVGYHKDSLDMSMIKNRIEMCLAKILEKDQEYRERAETELKGFEKQLETYLGRVAYIHIAHKSYENELTNFNIKTYEILKEPNNKPVHIGVDSGQAGFFDYEKYKSSVEDMNGRDKNTTFHKFYMELCDLTLDKKSFGTIDFGCVSSSGYGDGGYNCYVKRNNRGEAISAMIVFIDEYTEEE